MPDSPEDLRRVKAGPMLGGAAKIGPQPEPSFSRKALEMLTGYPADPMRDMTPMDGVNMLGAGLGAAGAVKGLQMGGRALMSKFGPSSARGLTRAANRPFHGSPGRGSGMDLLDNPRGLAAMERMSKEPNPYFDPSNPQAFRDSIEMSTNQMNTDLSQLRAPRAQGPQEPGLSEAALKALRYVPEPFEPWAGVRKIKEAVGWQKPGFKYPRGRGEAHGAPVEILD